MISRAGNCASARRTKAEPMKPAPPVTKILFTSSWGVSQRLLTSAPARPLRIVLAVELATGFQWLDHSKELRVRFPAREERSTYNRRQQFLKLHKSHGRIRRESTSEGARLRSVACRTSVQMLVNRGGYRRRHRRSRRGILE